MKTIIVLGLNGSTSLGVIRSLKFEFNVVGIELSEEYGLASYSRYLKSKYLVKGGFSDLMLFIRDNFNHNSFIVPTEDRYLEFFDLYSSTLRKHGFSFPCSNKFKYTDLLNKSFINNILESLPICIPRQYDLNHIKTDENSFPLILKPKSSVKYTKKDFVVFESREELDNYLCDFVLLNDFYLEEFISGGSKNMFEVLAYRNSQIENIPCVIQKIRQFPAKIGSSSFVRTVKDTELTQTTKLILKQIAFDGIVDVEFKYCNVRKKYFFIEINLRPGAPIFLSTAAGVNIVKEWINCKNSKGVNCLVNYSWINDCSDYVNIKQGFKECCVIVMDYLKSNSYAFFSIRDLNPFIYMIKDKVSKKFKIK